MSVNLAEVRAALAEAEDDGRPGDAEADGDVPFMLLGAGLGDADVFALAAKGGQLCVAGFFIRGGQNWGHRSFFPAHVSGVPEEEVMASFLMQFYEGVPPPKTILL